jgi:hypothetical protein
MPPRRFKHRERAVDVGAEIGSRLLDRGHNIRPRRKVEYPIDPFGCLRDKCDVRDIALNDFQQPAAIMLSEVRTAADHEVVQYTYASPASDQSIDQVASDKTGTARDQVAPFRTPRHCFERPPLAICGPYRYNRVKCK